MWQFCFRNHVFFYYLDNPPQPRFFFFFFKNDNDNVDTYETLTYLHNANALFWHPWYFIPNASFLGQVFHLFNYLMKFMHQAKDHCLLLQYF